MPLRTPRRRISPRSKRRCRVIRNFFLRALGTSSQQGIRINSSIALNVTDINYKINGLEQQLNSVSRHCQALNQSQNCSTWQSQESVVCHCEDGKKELSSNFISADHDPKESSITTTFLYEPSKVSRKQSNEGYYDPVQNFNNAEKESPTSLANMRPELRTPYQSKVRKKKSKFDNRTTATNATVCDCDLKLHKHRTKSALETVTPAYISSNYLSSAQPNAPPGSRERRRRDPERNYIEPPPPSDDIYKRQKNTTPQKKSHSPQRCSKKKHETPMENEHQQNSKEKQHYPSVDEDFIQELIKRQYMPTKIIGGTRSNFSQYSEPVCRDREYSSMVQEELCLCMYDEPYIQEAPAPRRRHMHRGRPDSLSACDARSLPARRSRSRSRPRPRYTYYDPYNDADLYDMVPVKEKRSPKFRQKYVDNINYNNYREVPPSPRSLRPKLNLKAQLHADCEEHLNSKRLTEANANSAGNHQRKRPQYVDTDESDATFELITRKETKLLKPAKVQTSLPNRQNASPLLSNMQYGKSNEPETSNDINLNNSQETDISRKTDKTLCEIKDILQSFLQEIKTEALQVDKLNETKMTNQAKQTSGNGVGQMSSVSMAPGTGHCTQSFMTDINGPQIYMPGMTSLQPQTPGIANPLPQMPCMNGPPPMSGVNDQPLMIPKPQRDHAFNTYTVAHCNVPNTFPTNLNSCCYSTLPGCSVDCANINSSSIHCQPGNVSHTCHPGNNPSNETLCQNCTNKKESKTEMERSAETEELIKEIYKFVTLNPMKKNWDKQKKGPQMTSRSVGSSHRERLSRHDMNVGTPAMRCYSKSCEAIGSRMITEMSYTTRSDTMLDKLSLDVSHSDVELPDFKEQEQVKKKKTLTNVFKSIFKKKKTPPETTETTTEGSYDVRPNYENTPFRQEVTNYMMTGQEFFNKPRSPSPPRRPHGGQFVPPPPARPGCEHSGPYYRSRSPSPPPVPRGPRGPRGSHQSHYLSTPSSSTYTPHPLHGQTIPEYESPYPPPGYPSPYFDPHTRSTYPAQPSYHDPQMQMYLREIEVKSTGTQSDRKIPFLHKLGRKASPSPPRFSQSPPRFSQPPPRFSQPPPHFSQPPPHFSQPPLTRTEIQAQTYRNPSPPQPVEPSQPNKLLSKWKQFQEKVQNDINQDPVAYGFSTQSKLLKNNKNVRTEMLKKMFYKRNPFSPNNLIIRTLLGNDPSSFGVPQGNLRPRLLL